MRKAKRGRVAEAQSIAFDLTGAEQRGTDGVMSCEDSVTHRELAASGDGAKFSGGAGRGTLFMKCSDGLND